MTKKAKVATDSEHPPVKKRKPKAYLVVAVSSRIPVEKMAAKVEEVLNRRSKQGRPTSIEKLEKGLLIISGSPEERPQGLFAVVGGPGGITPDKFVWRSFVEEAVNATKAPMWGKAAKDELPAIVNQMIKSNKLSPEKIRDLSRIMDEQGSAHKCDNPSCPLGEASLIIAESLRTHLKENLQ